MLEDFLLYVLLYLFLLPPVLYLILYKRTGKEARIITIVCYCLTMFIFLNIQDFFPKKITNPIFTLLEYLFFSLLIFQNIKSKINKLIIIVVSFSFVVFLIVYFFSIHRRKFDSVPIGVEAILIFIFVFLFFSEQVKTTTNQPIYSNYFFWIAVGFVVYLGGSFFVYILANTIPRSELDKYWSLTYVVEIIKNILMAASIIIYSNNPIKKSSKQRLPDLDFMI